jgi:hypothetical protein
VRSQVGHAGSKGVLPVRPHGAQRTGQVTVPRAAARTCRPQTTSSTTASSLSAAGCPSRAAVKAREPLVGELQGGQPPQRRSSPGRPLRSCKTNRPVTAKHTKGPLTGRLIPLELLNLASRLRHRVRVSPSDGAASGPSINWPAVREQSCRLRLAPAVDPKSRRPRY